MSGDRAVWRNPRTIVALLVTLAAVTLASLVIFVAGAGNSSACPACEEGSTDPCECVEELVWEWPF